MNFRGSDLHGGSSARTQEGRKPSPIPGKPCGRFRPEVSGSPDLQDPPSPFGSRCSYYFAVFRLILTLRPEPTSPALFGFSGFP